MDLNDFDVNLNFWDDSADLLHKPCNTLISIPTHKDITLKELTDLAYDHECPSKKE